MSATTVSAAPPASGVPAPAGRPGAAGLAGHWEELVTLALLGTDRREPPPPPAGALADLVADAQRGSPSQRMILQVAGCVAARRGGLRPAAPAAPLDPPPDDQRPPTSPAVTEVWRHVVRAWPLLEDELLELVVAGGRRPAPDLLVGLLRRHRRGAPTRGLVELAGGELARWMCRHFPELDPTGAVHRGDRGAPASGGQPAPAPGPAAARGAPLVPAELRPLLSAAPVDVAVALHRGIVEQGWGAPHRAVLVNLVAAVAVDALEPVAAQLEGVPAGHPGHALALALADCARTRHRVHVELHPARRDAVPPSDAPARPEQDGAR
jgi:hypothetical protein